MAVLYPAGYPRTVISRTYAPITGTTPAPVGISSVPAPSPRPVAPVAVLPTTHPVLPQPALPQPVTVPPVSVISPVVPVPVVPSIGPPLSPGAFQSVLQPTITPDQIATQYGAYQEPIPYALTTPVVSIPASTDVGTPVTGSETTSFGLTENTWLILLIAAAVVLVLVSE